MKSSAIIAIVVALVASANAVAINDIPTGKVEYKPEYPEKECKEYKKEEYPEKKEEYKPEYPEKKEEYKPEYPEKKKEYKPEYPEKKDEYKPEYPEKKPEYKPEYPEKEPEYKPEYPEKKEEYKPEYEEHVKGTLDFVDKKYPEYHWPTFPTYPPKIVTPKCPNLKNCKKVRGLGQPVFANIGPSAQVICVYTFDNTNSCNLAITGSFCSLQGLFFGVNDVISDAYGNTVVRGC